MATETWLKDTDRDEPWLLGSCTNKGDFRCVTSNRSGTKKGGGLAIVYKPGSGIKCVSMENGEKSSFQFAVWKLEIKNKVLTVVRITIHQPNILSVIQMPYSLLNLWILWVNYN